MTSKLFIEGEEYDASDEEGVDVVYVDENAPLEDLFEVMMSSLAHIASADVPEGITDLRKLIHDAVDDVFDYTENPTHHGAPEALQ